MPDQGYQDAEIRFEHVRRGIGFVVGLLLFLVVVLAVFSAVVLLWVTNTFWGSLFGASVARRFEWLDEYTIAIFGALLLFVVPVKWKNRIFSLDWKDSKYADWGTLLLFGGGIALSDAMFRTGLASWIATNFVGIVGHAPSVVMVLVIVLMVIMLTEVTSNTAVTSMMVPIVITIAVGTGIDPTTLVLSAAIAASLAFTLPVATPPNALVYGTGYIKVRQMAKAGLILDLIAWLLTVVILYVIGDYVFGIVQF